MDFISLLNPRTSGPRWVILGSLKLIVGLTMDNFAEPPRDEEYEGYQDTAEERNSGRKFEFYWESLNAAELGTNVANIEITI